MLWVQERQTAEPSNGIPLRHRRDVGRTATAKMTLQWCQLRPAQRTQPGTLLRRSCHPLRHLLCPHTDSLLMMLWGTVIIFSPGEYAAPSTTPGRWTGKRGDTAELLLLLSQGENAPGLGQTQDIDELQTKGRGNENHGYPPTNGHWEVLPPRPSIKVLQVIPDSTESYVNHNLHSVWPPISYSTLLPDERL